MKRKVFLFILSVSLILGSLAGCGTKETSGSDSSSDVIKIGVFEPMTGASAAGGEMTVEGIKLANEKVGEVLGKKVELVIVDNKSDKVEAANAASRLIDKDKVVAIIGSYSSSLSMAAGDIVKAAKVPAVGCSPTNPLVTLNNDYYFRVCFIDPFQGTVMANYAFNDLSASKAAIIQDVQQDYSVGLSTYFEQAFVELTGSQDSIVGKASYNTGDQDFSAQLTNIKSLNPDVIFAPGNYGESALLIKQARDLGITVPILGGDTWEAPEFIDIGGAAVEGAVYSTHFTSESPVTEVSKTFLEDYKAKFNKDANAFAALGYDAYMVIIDAIEKAGSADSVAIKEKLAGTKDFIGSTGVITLDENGDAVKSAVINQVKDGKFVYLTTVEPIK
ncbi:ABC transporter substrate-binding protein [Tissierella praeacuta]|uniref:ABC transporter substrate-binding protein n=1 Tax=Tissierella praeacuta TaxID=43131 RepID=UPI000EE81FDE|nr:ABC transporter substrate-binding protein [Tissierella praeacuta]MBU5255603.1 ABC transporter substrate-binding protein [Tissierella praeacuta]HAE92827.1 branched-chain amino acid ABC transporter substrate-binding protein [Tissierella sp.]